MSYSETHVVEYTGATFIDFPTAFWLTEQEGYEHASETCSAVQTAGALLCDCDALQRTWERLNRPRVCRSAAASSLRGAE